MATTSKWTTKVIKAHIENGKLLYEQLSEESKRKVASDVEGTQRKAEFQSKKDAWDNANDLLTKIAKLEERYEQSRSNNSILTEEEREGEFRGGYAETQAR